MSIIVPPGRPTIIQRGSAQTVTLTGTNRQTLAQPAAGNQVVRPCDPTTVEVLSPTTKTVKVVTGGPKGDPGDPGPKGDPGPPGPPGGAPIVSDGTLEVAYAPDGSEVEVSLASAYRDKIEASIVPANVAKDGDMLEYNAVTGEWVAKNDPRELLIDGGNF